MSSLMPCTTPSMHVSRELCIFMWLKLDYGTALLNAFTKLPVKSHISPGENIQCSLFSSKTLCIFLGSENKSVTDQRWHQALCEIHFCGNWWKWNIAKVLLVKKHGTFTGMLSQLTYDDMHEYRLLWLKKCEHIANLIRIVAEIMKQICYKMDLKSPVSYRFECLRTYM